MVAGGELLVAAVALGVARPGTDGRLDHELVRIRERLQKAAQGLHGLGIGLHERGRHRGDADGGQISQIVLVGVPADHVQRVEQQGRTVHPFGPCQELRQPFGVVPGRAEQDSVETPPVHGGIVPGHGAGMQAGIGTRIEQGNEVIVMPGGSDGGDEGDGSHGGSVRARPAPDSHCPKVPVSGMGGWVECRLSPSNGSRHGG